jgi:hypothetical protein
MKNFIKNGLSLDEFKVSSLIIALLVFSGVGIYAFFKNGDIPPNFMSILTTIVVTVGGVNAAKLFTNSFSSKDEPSSPDSEA